MKRKTKSRTILGIELIVICGILLVLPHLQDAEVHFSRNTFSFGDTTYANNYSKEGNEDLSSDLPAISISDVPWNLILVNKANPLPEDFDLEFTELSNGQRVDKRIYPDLQAMFDDARSQDIYPFVREGFRTHSEQQAIFDDKVRSFRLQGHLKKDAQQMAAQWVAIPGTSEHELGLAVDINADSAYSTNDDVYLWLKENAWKYGFILRYPQGKEEITGIDYEPWHYRYVGREAAEEITKAGITLEEYLQNR